MKLEEFTKKINDIQTNGPGTPKPAREKIDGRTEYETNKLKADAERAREICFMCAEATRKTEMLREELIKGTAAGEDWETLFFKAVKIIGLATSDTGILPIIEGAARRYKEKNTTGP